MYAVVYCANMQPSTWRKTTSYHCSRTINQKREIERAFSKLQIPCLCLFSIMIEEVLHCTSYSLLSCVCQTRVSHSLSNKWDDEVDDMCTAVVHKIWGARESQYIGFVEHQTNLIGDEPKSIKKVHYSIHLSSLPFELWNGERQAFSSWILPPLSALTSSHIKLRR